MTLIDKRPLEVAKRTVSGHWEGDLIIGKYHKSALLITVERQTRYVQIDLLHNYTAPIVKKKIVNRFRRLAPHLRKTIPLDQVQENARHEEIAKQLKMKVYFCHPASPWEKATCENTNFLIRDMLDGETDFRKLTQYQVSRIARLLNEHPRKTLNFKKPNEVFALLC